MSFQNFKKFSTKLLSGEQSTKVKIFSTLSLLWMILIGYLVWWNGLKSPGFDKSFKWDEWIKVWFCTSHDPIYNLYYLEKGKNKLKKLLKNYFWIFIYFIFHK